MHLATKNVATVFVGVGMVLALSFAFVTPAKADLLADLQAQVQALLAQISALQGGTTPTTGGSCFTFTRNHQLGDTGGEVMEIQKFLNKNGAQVAASGAGSVGNETSYFGSLTRAAVSKFQTANGITPTAGYWGPITRAKANAMCTPTSGGTTGGTTTPTGPGLTVFAGTQPANSLAPESAARVPFTTFTLTNNSGAAVTVNGIQVKRTGLGANAVFTGIVLIDSNGLQVGIAKTLNSNDEATVGDTFTINPGQSQTFTVAGNMASVLDSYAGQVVSLSVVGVNTSAPVAGSLPITGAQQTVNASLSMGSISTSSSAFDPGSNQTKSIGDTNVRFSGVRFTAGSAEDVRLFSVRWRQVGSASSVDLANVMTYINGTAYPTTVDASGRFYTTTIPGGILITKGNSIDVYVQGDIVGSNSSGRTIEFNIDKVTDVYFVGQTYGYGIAPSGTNTPWYDTYVVTVQGGSATTISKANEVPAQNIAVNVAGQPLGGFVADFKGESVSVQGMTFTYATGTASVGLLTNITLVDENGVVVAGPVDATWSGTTATFVFSDTVTFPVGRKVYTLKGKVPSGAGNGATITVSTTPSGWTSPTGQTSGNSVTISQGAFSMNAMTVKSAALAVAVSASPAAQSIVAGGVGTHFATYQFDATQSGEDVRFTTLGLQASTSANLSATNVLTSCQIFDGTTPLNTGSNVVNPTVTNAAKASVAFALDNPFVVTKGTVKELMLKCNVAAGATGGVKWGLSSSNISGIAATGVTSGNSVTVTGTASDGQAMTISTGSLAVSTDASSPSYTLVSGGSQGVTLGVYKFRASNESVNLQRIGLMLSNTASSSATDLTQVTLWNGTTQIGSAVFVGANMHATSTLTSPVLLTKDTDVVITVKGNMAAVGGSNAGTTGHLVAVDVDANGTNTQGTGVGSGTTINASGSTAVAGVRLFKSFPVIADESGSGALSSTGVQDGRLMRFRVTADSQGPIGVGKVTIKVATTSATVTNVNVYAYTDASYSTPVSGVRSDGALLASNLATIADNAEVDVVASSPVQVPAGATRYFEVRGSVTGVSTGSSVVTTLAGDSAYPSLALTVFMDDRTALDSDDNDNFLWSPNSDGTSADATVDWTNGFGVVGLPSSGLTKTRSN